MSDHLHDTQDKWEEERERRFLLASYDNLAVERKLLAEEFEKIARGVHTAVREDVDGIIDSFHKLCDELKEWKEHVDYVESELEGESL